MNARGKLNVAFVVAPLAVASAFWLMTDSGWLFIIVLGALLLFHFWQRQIRLG